MTLTALAAASLAFDGPRRRRRSFRSSWRNAPLDGHYYALPYMRSTEACYVNKTYVEKLGYTLPETLTWDFIWEVSEAATNKRRRRNLCGQWSGRHDPFHLQVHRQYDDPDVWPQKDAGYSTAPARHRDFSTIRQRTSCLNIAEHTEDRCFFHLQDFRLSGQLPQCRPVHLRH